MVNLDPNYVRKSLRRLSAKRPDVFGASAHGFEPQAVLQETHVRNFEREYGICLPAEYRHFITQVGNGGAGPYYGVFPLGEMDGLEATLQKWHENDGFVGVLSESFRLACNWNDLTGKPEDGLLMTDEGQYWKEFEQFEKNYFSSSIVDGAIPICHEGCALRIWLVVSGPQAGYVWRDSRSEYGGLTPLQTADGAPATFSIWYKEWLENALELLAS
jgi:hypothetical protein